jgi:hypothetical protein
MGRLVITQPATVGVSKHGGALRTARPILASHILVGRKSVPSDFEPVRMSWRLGLSPMPLFTSPFSVSAVCLVRLLSPCSSATSLAMITPLAFIQGPLPMRSRAFTAPAPCVDR